MVELARLNMVVDRLVHACMLECSWLDERTDLNNVVETIMINKQPCSCMHACKYMLSGNDEIARLNSDVTTTMNLVVVC